MHENPRATEQEQELAQEGRLQEEEAMQYPGHESDDVPLDPDDVDRE